MPYGHLLVLNRKLIDIAAGRLFRLMVFMPPQHGKSEMISRFFPAWYLGTFPDRRVILASYEADFASTWGRKARDLLEEHGPSFFGIQVSHSSSAASRWDIERHSGGMVTAGARGAITGKGANLFIIDDPVKNHEQAVSPLYQERNYDWYRSVARTRLRKGAAVIVVMTRWHENDLAGKLLQDAESDGEKWDVLKLSALAKENDPLGRKEGEALCPELHDKEYLQETRRSIGTFWWSALYDQEPSPDEGGIFKRWWWKFWQPAGASLPPVPIKDKDGKVIEIEPVTLPGKFDMQAQSWDMAFKDTQSSAYVVGQVWGKVGADKYLLDQDREKRDFVSTMAAVVSLTVKFPKAKHKWIEDKANGPAVISALQKEIAGLIAIEPHGSKVARAYAVSPQVESGNVYLPHPAVAPWVWDFIKECLAFPNASYSDQVDAMTQALNEMESAAVILDEKTKKLFRGVSLHG